jgi:hypothetical protein
MPAQAARTETHKRIENLDTIAIAFISATAKTGKGAADFGKAPMQGCDSDEVTSRPKG